MTKLEDLTIDELDVLYKGFGELREQVLKAVQAVGYNVNDLVTQKIERDIESMYGKKCLSSVTSSSLDKEKRIS